MSSIWYLIFIKNLTYHRIKQGMKDISVKRLMLPDSHKVSVNPGRQEQLNDPLLLEQEALFWQGTLEHSSISTKHKPYPNRELHLQSL